VVEDGDDRDDRNVDEEVEEEDGGADV